MTNIIAFPVPKSNLSLEDKRKLLDRLHYLISKQKPKLRRKMQRELTDLMHDMLRHEVRQIVDNKNLCLTM